MSFLVYAFKISFNLIHVFNKYSYMAELIFVYLCCVTLLNSSVLVTLL